MIKIQSLIVIFKMLTHINIFILKEVLYKY